ncbi:YgfZ/GcvT domain-containing protein [Mycolicibacter sinensis]|uniref:Glycine cleavage system protein T n=1 Tax=Mycolicibacter sinensis (strain JDM601) TaxID=875328 RepID=A0A1A2NV67_MYCSD|nr:folate-binding protein YgfZ [Mycolicibacter sinensis]OBH18960.1 glycine cleavage system protein T [Mycolicibacter sinensis]OBI30264.1 glycine cleavage system protein T [Mycolicibacter sinensis]
MSAVPAPDPGPDAGAVWHYGDPFGEQRSAQSEAVLVDRSHRAVLAVGGPERKTWLHTLCTQHVAELPDGASTENLILDAHGHITDHWVQTELDGTTYLDTEPWRGEPLTAHLRKMVFWADVTIQPADLAVLSLLGPRLADPAVRDALGVAALPDTEAVAIGDSGAFLRPGPGEHTLELLVPPAEKGGWQRRLTQAGVRPAGVWTYEAARVAARRPRLGLDTDERSIPHEMNWIGGPGVGAVHLNKGCYSGQETVARVHNLGKPPRMLVLLHLDGSVDRPATGDPISSGGRPVGRLGTVVDHFELGPIALALLKRGLPADTPLSTGPGAEVSAVIDAESLPPPDVRGAGRVAVDRLRGRV